MIVDIEKLKLDYYEVIILIIYLLANKYYRYLFKKIASILFNKRYTNYFIIWRYR